MSHKLVVSATQMVVYVLKGHDFSRAINGAKTSRALAPEGSLFRDVRPFASIGKGLYLRWPTLDRAPWIKPTAMIQKRSVRPW